MSTKNHLKTIVNILRENHQDEIEQEGDWTWNCKRWTIQFLDDVYCEKVIAYRVKNNSTDWSDYIKIEHREAIWKDML